MVGACVSLTVAVKVQVESGLSGLESLAVQVTVVTPRLKVAPEGGAQVTVGVPQLSVAVGGVKVAVPLHCPGVLFTVTGLGQAPMTGACVSLTVTVKVHIGPAPVEQVTVVTPMLKLEPETGEQVTVPQVPVVVGAA